MVKSEIARGGADETKGEENITVSIRRIWVNSICAGVSIGLFAVSANAVPVGSTSPIPGFDVDSGAELFLPENTVVSFEIADVLGSVALNTFSFYFESDPGTLISIFAADDQAPPDQGASIDFVNGIVLDLDAAAVQSTFTPLDEAIGFVFVFDFQPGVPGGEGAAWSQVAYNGGVDAVGTYQSTSDPLTSLITLELNGNFFAVESASGIDPIQPIPEPASPLLFGAGILIVGAAVRRSNAS
jgi:hypothetical protein